MDDRSGDGRSGDMGFADRWGRLFADLEAELAAQTRAEFDSEVADRTRRERALVSLAARLGAHRGASRAPLEIALAPGIRVHGRVVDVGNDWVALAPSPYRAALVPLAAVTSVVGLGRESIDPGSGRRFGLGYALREISRDRQRVQVLDLGGTSYEGTVDIVGADFVDLAEHPRDEARRPGNVRLVRTIPVAALACVQSG